MGDFYQFAFMNGHILCDFPFNKNKIYQNVL